MPDDIFSHSESDASYNLEEIKKLFENLGMYQELKYYLN